MVDRLNGHVGVLALALVVLPACTGGAQTSADFSKTPIVFVHGSGLSPESWDAMRAHLAARGYPREYMTAVVIPPARSANDVAAKETIARAVDQVIETVAAERARRGLAHGGEVDLIAHSMGAFSSRYYAALLAPEHVRTWIGVAGSNYGTSKLCHSSLPGDRQMCPPFAQSADESAIQVLLNGTDESPRDASPYGLGPDGDAASLPPTTDRCIAYYTIRIEPDEWIEPATSAKLHGAGGLQVDASGLPVRQTEPGNFLFTGLADHDHLPEHPQLISLVERILGAADQQWPERCGDVQVTSRGAST